MFDFESFCRDYSIDHDVRKDNIIVFDCPLCSSSKGSRTKTGGYIKHKNGGFFKCFRCGTSSAIEVLEALTGLDRSKCFRIRKEYETDEFFREELEEKKHVEELILPPLKEIDNDYRNYLTNRNLNVDVVVDRYSLMFTNHYGKFSDLPDRIIFPVFAVGRYKKPISYTARSILSEEKIRYQSCHSEHEVMPVKHSLYGINLCDLSKPVIVCEGCFDAIHCGEQAVSTLGIEYTNEQVLLLKNCPEVFIVYDSEPLALEKADKFATQLNYFTKARVFDIESEKDLGEFNKDEVESLRTFLGMRPNKFKENLLK